MHPRKKTLSKLGISLAPFLLMGASQCSSIPLDPSMSAALAGDKTIEFQGAGSKSKKGYLFVQKRDGAPVNEDLAFVLPDLDCKRESCVSFQFFRKDGTPGLSGGVKKGEKIHPFSLALVVGHDGVTLPSDEGEYSAVIRIYFTGPDGQEYSALQNGFVRLNVLAKGYVPLGCDDPNAAWKVSVDKDCEAQFTSAGRSVNCGDCDVR